MSKYLPVFPRQPSDRILDSSAITTFKDCPRRFFFQYELSLVPKHDVIYFAWGKAYHKFRELIEVAYMQGDTSGAVDVATREAFALFRKGIPNDPNPQDKVSFYTGQRFLQSILAAYQHWTREKLTKEIEVIAVEQAFNVLLPSGQRTSGRADQIIRLRTSKRIYGRDFKTTSKNPAYYARGLDPNDQLTRYTYAESLLSSSRIEGQLVEVLYNDKTHGPDITTFPIAISPWRITDWLRSEQYWHEAIAKCRETETWPQNEKGCGFCQYHDVCKKGSEFAQENVLRQNYILRVWDNTSDD